jgi:predicted dehydrogenase
MKRFLEGDIMSDILTIGFVGCGGMMDAHAGGLKKLWEKDIRHFRVTAACDIDPARAERMADQIAAWQGTKPTVYTDTTDMLSKENNLDAVDLSLVHRVHHSVAVQCIQAGKHVTAEKPLAITLRAGKLIMDSANKSGKVFQVAENYRKAPVERAFNWLLKQGRIGNTRMVFWVDVTERLWHWGWRDDIDQSGGGWSMDGGVHFADLFRYHIGEIEELYCVSKSYTPNRYTSAETMDKPIPTSTEDTTMAVLKFANGVTGQWTSTLAAPGSKSTFRAIYGENGSLRWDEGLQTRTESMPVHQIVNEYMASLSEDERERLFPRGVVDTIAIELKEFIDASLYGTPIEMTALEGYKDEAISLALYESSALGAPVKMSDVESLALETYQSRFNKSLGLV